jgi:hypothetical protein
VPLEWSKFASLLGSSGMVNCVINSLKTDCEITKHTCTSCCTLGGVGTFAKEKKLELKRINSKKKRSH